MSPSHLFSAARLRCLWRKWRERLSIRTIQLTRLTACRIIGQCQAAVAEAVSAFGRIDVLFCCSSEGTAVTSTLSHCLHEGPTR